MAQFVRIYFRDKRINSVKELIDQNNIKNITVEQFLDTKSPESSIKNRDELFLSYTTQQKKELNLLSPNDIKDTTKIYPPAILWVPIDKVEIDIIKYDSEFSKEIYPEAFVGEQIAKIVNSSGYYTNLFTKTYPKCSVWVWVKAIEGNRYMGGVNSNSIVGKILNISPFIQDVDISVTETGGNFSINLPFIPASSSVLVKEDSSSLPDEYFDIIDLDMSDIHFSGIEEYVVDTTMFKYDERRMNFLNIAMQSNDLVFIKFEQVEKEITDIVDELFLNKRILPNQYFDMIGLIDRVVQPTKPEDIGVNVQGRDLMKLFLDDGSFFFPNSYVSKDFDKGIFINSSGQSDSLNTFNVIRDTVGGNPEGRIITDGLIKEFFSPKARSIHSAFEVLVKTLSNIEIVPSSLFDSYGDKRSKFNINKKINKK